MGIGFGLSGVRPVPAIILAQALNGILLPFAAVFLLLAVNDRGLMGEAGLNGTLANLAMSLVVLVALLLGVSEPPARPGRRPGPRRAPARGCSCWSPPASAWGWPCPCCAPPGCAAARPAPLAPPHAPA